jgi:hypothetical protein
MPDVCEPVRDAARAESIEPSLFIDHRSSIIAPSINAIRSARRLGD